MLGDILGRHIEQFTPLRKAEHQLGQRGQGEAASLQTRRGLEETSGGEEEVIQHLLILASLLLLLDTDSGR